MISMNWVKDYVDIKDENLEQLADKITKAGINVEKVISNHIDNLVIGEVTSCVNHPDSDHLHVCLVNVGSDIKQIVCGAPNVREGIKVIVALPGAVLPGNITISKSKKRGIDSDGMICALFELGLEEKNEENYNKGIAELDSNASIGMDAMEYLKASDTLYDLDIHKHKNNDATNHIGFAYEVGTILGKKVTLPDTSYNEIDDSIKNYVDLKVNTSNCTYYKARMVTNLQIGESPDFIKKRLTACGMRSINNVVDISNYVMLEYGQPLHFFDKEKLGNKIVVRMANDEEEVVTLDGKQRILSSNDIVISNGDKVVAIAGVMGAENTDVDENTRTVLIESAIFNPYSIRKTEKSLNLRSEASMRYEKGLNFEYTNYALDRACHLLEKYAGGKVYSDYILYDNEDKSLKKIMFSTNKINSLLGLSLTATDIERQLNKLDFEYKINGNNFEVIVPRRRLDIEENVNDIAEEIGRLYGYHNLKNTLPILPTREGKYADNIYLRKIISKRLRSLGLNEVRTYSLVDKTGADLFNKDKKIIELPNPMSQDKTALRKTLIPSLMEVIRYNKSRGLKDINIYEISKVFYDDFKEENCLCIMMYGSYLINNWQGIKVNNDFYILKGIAENLLNYLGLKNRYSFVLGTEENMHPGISADILLDRQKVGHFGRIHPNLCKEEIYALELFIEKLDVNIKPIKFKQASKLPSVKKDLAFIMPKDMENSEVESIIRKSGGRLLTNVEVFDLYTGENVSNDEKSIAYTLTFSDPTKTLNEEEVMSIFNKIIHNVESQTSCKLRNK